MSHQLAYVIVTPYSLYKSRTGGILSRLISRTGLDLVAMRMFAPSAELVKEYAKTIVSAYSFTSSALGANIRIAAKSRPVREMRRLKMPPLRDL